MMLKPESEAVGDEPGLADEPSPAGAPITGGVHFDWSRGPLNRRPETRTTIQTELQKNNVARSNVPLNPFSKGFQCAHG